MFIRSLIGFLARAVTCAKRLNGLWAPVVALYIGVLISIFGSNQALAATISVDGVAYNVQFTTGESFTDNQALLLSQTWWGDAVRAEAFRDAYYATNTVDDVPFFVWDSSATENTDRLFFAYETLGPVPGGGVRSSTIQDVYSGVTGTDAVGQSATDSSGVAIHYAYVSAASVPEINAGALSQVVLILFALWLVITCRYKSQWVS